MRIAPSLRTAASVLVGYGVIVVCTSIGFKPLGGVVHVHAPLGIQAAGVVVAIVSGLLGGATAALIAPGHPVRHAAAVLIFLGIDTAVVLSRGVDPAWFELAGSATLMLATLGGGVLYALATRHLRPPRAPHSDGTDPLP